MWKKSMQQQNKATKYSHWKCWREEKDCVGVELRYLFTPAALYKGPQVYTAAFSTLLKSLWKQQQSGVVEDRQELFQIHNFL